MYGLLWSILTPSQMGCINHKMMYILGLMAREVMAMSRAKDLALNWIFLSPKSHNRSFCAVLVTPGSPKGAFLVLFSYSFSDHTGLAFLSLGSLAICFSFNKIM